MDQHVVILMSTYNGQDYLKEQLDSIWRQTYPGDITILIRDDGSTYDIGVIAQSYDPTDNRRVEFVKAANVGPQRSFLELIRMAPEADYYFFADQDDVWDANKIELAVTAMAGHREPVCYCSNFRYSHTDLSVCEEKALQKAPSFTPLRIIFYNQIPGCVMGFNQALMVLLKRIRLDSVMMHDSMALALTAACGQVIYDPESRITHRIHASNVVGRGHKKIVLRKWIPEKLKLLRSKEDYDLSAMAEQFLAVAEELLHPEYKKDLLILRDFKKSRKNTSCLLRHPDAKGPAFDRTVLSIRSKIFFRLF